MAENTAESVAKAPVTTTEVKAPDTSNSLPPITKEPIATAEASLVPSVPAEPTPTDAPAAPSSDTATKPDAPAAAEAKEASTNKPSESDGTDPDPEKSSESVSSQAEPATTENVASGVESDAPAGPSDGAVAPPKPVSLEEVRDEGLPDAGPSKEKPAEEAPKTNAIHSTPAANGNGIVNNKRKAEAVEDAGEPGANGAKDEGPEPAEKKVTINGATTNGTARKPGRPRKDKKAAPVVGRTARKTRSQGAAD